MRTLLLVVVALCLGSAAGWHFREAVRKAEEQPVRALHLYMFWDRLDEPRLHYLSASGTWIGDSLANKTNTVKILCDPSAKTCEVSQADVTTLVYSRALSLESTTYNISRIDAQSLLAENRPGEGCVRETLLFDRLAKRVSFMRTKIKNEPPCHMVQDEPVMLYLGDPR